MPKHYKGLIGSARKKALEEHRAIKAEGSIPSYDAGGRVNRIEGYTSDTMSPSYMGGYQEGGEAKENEEKEDISGLVEGKYWKHGRNVVDLKKEERKTGLDPKYRPKSREKRKKETAEYIKKVKTKVKTKVKKFAKDVKERVGRGVYKRKKRKLENLPKKEKRLKKSISKFKKNNPEDFDESGALKAYKDVEK